MKINTITYTGSRTYGFQKIEITLEAQVEQGEKVSNVEAETSKMVQALLDREYNSLKARVDAQKDAEDKEKAEKAKAKEEERLANKLPETKEEAYNIVVNGKTLQDYNFKEIQALESQYAADTKIGFAVRLILDKVTVKPKATTQTYSGDSELTTLLNTNCGKFVRGGNHQIKDATKKEVEWFQDTETFQNAWVGGLKKKILRAIELGWQPR